MIYTMKNSYNISVGSEKGITLIEIVLAVTVIVILMAVIVPRALRTNVEAKYVGVRQAAQEIGRWGMDWATRNLESQPYEATCNLNDYITTLEGYVGNTTETNWIEVNEDLTEGGRCRSEPDENGENYPVNYSVADIVPIDSQPLNPFNGLSYFNIEGGNNGSRLQAGLLYLASVDVDGVNHYYFVYTGTDSNSVDEWHAGMGQGTEPDYANLRNGVLMTSQRP